MKTILSILAAAVSATAALAAPQPVSLASGTLTTAAGNSFLPVVSANGQRAVFVSHANNLTTNDDAGQWLDVFVRNLTTSTTRLVSVSTNGVGGGNQDSAWASLSADGRYVAFASRAGNLVNGDTNDAHDVFVRDLIAGVTRLISVDPDGNVPGDEQIGFSIVPLSGNPLISASGDRVFFESRAMNRGMDFAIIRFSNIYMRNLLSNSTVLVSASAGGAPFTNYCELTSISTNGQFAAFIARSTESRFTSSGDVYVRDLNANTTIQASAAVAAYAATYRCGEARLTPDGHFVTYIAGGLPQVTVLFRYELSSGLTIAVATNVLEQSTPQISTTGRYVTFTDGTNILRWDAATGSTTLANANVWGTVPASGVARNAVASSDANTIAFVSNSPDLTADSSTNLQAYARDMAAGTTRLLSAGTPGGASKGVDLFTVISITPSGVHAAFDTAAADLFLPDANSASDAFINQLVDGPHVLLTRLAGGSVELKWMTVPSATYTVQYKDAFDAAAWRNLDAAISLSGSLATTTDTTSAALSRYYRVLEAR